MDKHIYKIINNPIIYSKYEDEDELEFDDNDANDGTYNYCKLLDWFMISIASILLLPTLLALYLSIFY